MPSTSELQDWAAWRARNSDGKRSFGDEHMSDASRRIQSPPAFTLTDASLPTNTRQFTNPDDATLGRAIRHTHTWSVDEPE